MFRDLFHRRALDRLRPRPFATSAPRSVATIEAEVRRLVAGLAPRGIDEGTSDVLDQRLTAWALAWLTVVDTEHSNRTAAIDALVGRAAERVAAAEARHGQAHLRLRTAEHDHAAARRRLSGPDTVEETP